MTSESLLYAIVRSSALLVAWIGSYAIHSTLLLGGAWLITRLVQLDPGYRDALWKSALIAALITPTLQAIPGSLALGRRYDASRVVERQVWRTAGVSKPVAARDATQIFNARVGSTYEGIRLLPILLTTLWALYAAIVLARVLSATKRARAALGRRHETGDPSLRERFAQVAARFGLARDVRLTFSPERTSPVALGNTEICLPETLLAKLAPEEQESILAHEVAHLVRRDPSWLLTAVSIESVFFFQPLNRIARMRIQEEAEYLSDDLAVDRGSSGVTLARCLARVAEWMSTPTERLMAPALVEERSSLLRRVSRLLDSRTHPPRRARSLPRAAGAFALPVIVFLTAPGFTAGGPRAWGTPAFQWGEVIAPGKSIEIIGLMGDIRAERSTSLAVSVVATRHGRATDPDLRFAVVRHADGVTICTLYPTPSPVPANTCVPGGKGASHNTRANDVEVDFLVRVPDGVGFVGRTATGDIKATGLTAPAVAVTSSGHIELSTSSWARAETASGNVALRMGAASWPDTLPITTRSGDIRVALPRSASTVITARSTLGTVTSDFPIRGESPGFFARLRLRGSFGGWAEGVVGKGGRVLDVQSTTGNIEVVYAR